MHFEYRLNYNLKPQADSRKKLKLSAALAESTKGGLTEMVFYFKVFCRTIVITAHLRIYLLNTFQVTRQSSQHIRDQSEKQNENED